VTRENAVLIHMFPDNIYCCLMQGGGGGGFFMHDDRSNEVAEAPKELSTGSKLTWPVFRWILTLSNQASKCLSPIWAPRLLMRISRFAAS
jgi:hypothetical protein